MKRPGSGSPDLSTPAWYIGLVRSVTPRRRSPFWDASQSQHMRGVDVGLRKFSVWLNNSQSPRSCTHFPRHFPATGNPRRGNERPAQSCSGYASSLAQGVSSVPSVISLLRTAVWTSLDSRVAEVECKEFHDIANKPSASFVTPLSPRNPKAMECSPPTSSGKAGSVWNISQNPANCSRTYAHTLVGSHRRAALGKSQDESVAVHLVQGHQSIASQALPVASPAPHACHRVGCARAARWVRRLAGQPRWRTRGICSVAACTHAVANAISWLRLLTDSDTRRCRIPPPRPRATLGVGAGRCCESGLKRVRQSVATDATEQMVRMPQQIKKKRIRATRLHTQDRNTQNMTEKDRTNTETYRMTLQQETRVF